jgi:DNA adenine methylase
MSNKGHEVIISEYQAPDDFTCIWEKRITNSLSIKNTYNPIEKLFVKLK